MKNKYINVALPAGLVAIIDLVSKQYPIDEAKTAEMKAKLGFTDQHVPVMFTPAGEMGLFIGSTAEEKLIVVQLSFDGVGVLKAGTIKPKIGEGGNIEGLTQPPSKEILTDGMKEALDDFTGGQNRIITTTE